MEDFMKKTGISFKTFLIAATLTSPFVAEAGSAKAQLQRLNSNMDARLSDMEIDFANQDDNTTSSRLTASYKRRFAGQLKQLKGLLTQVTRAVNSGNFATGGRNSRRRVTSDDLRVAPMITNAIANIDRLGQLDSVDDATLQEAQAFLEGIQPNDTRLANQIEAALGILTRG
jgi:hypothetical protein